MKTALLIVSTLLPLYSPIVYIKSILKGESRPHRTTRFVYLVTGILTTLSLFAGHDQVALWISLVSTLQAMALFLFSFRFGTGGWSKTDILCLVLAAIGIVAWQTTKDPSAGLYFGIAADFAGTIPTIIKTFHHPKTENWQFYALDCLAGACNVLALNTFSGTSFAYPLYIVFVNGLISVLAMRSRLPVSSKGQCVEVPQQPAPDRPR